MGAAATAGMSAVCAVLKVLRLEVYAATFEEMGYDDLDYLVNTLSTEQLRKVAVDDLAMKPGHAHKLVACIRVAAQYCGQC